VSQVKIASGWGRADPEAPDGFDRAARPGCAPDVTRAAVRARRVAVVVDERAMRRGSDQNDNVDAPDFADSTPSGVDGGEPRIAVVVNGNARGVTGELISSLDQILNGGDLFVSQSLGDARRIARMLLEKGYDTVLTGGGDGTFTFMVTQMVREAKRLGYPLPRFGLLKLGTGNALAWVVGASRYKSGSSADIRRLHQEAGSRPMRLVEVEGVIAPFCGFGADAEVLMDYQHVRSLLSKTLLRPLSLGRRGYAISVLTRSFPGYVLRRQPHCRVINEGADAYRLGNKGSLTGPPIPSGEVIYEGPARIAALSTIPYYGFGFRAFPYAEERSDRMNLRISGIGVRDFVANFSAIWRGEYHNPDLVFDYLVESVRVQMDPPTAFQIGGDVHGVRAEVRARLSSDTIRLVDFYAPPRAA
jgi:diacylglycerol kinase family enzyme